jgi:hypothetical protein
MKTAPQGEEKAHLTPRWEERVLPSSPLFSAKE